MKNRIKMLVQVECIHCTSLEDVSVEFELKGSGNLVAETREHECLDCEEITEFTPVLKLETEAIIETRVLPGQMYRENDPRFERVVKVLCVQGDRVTILNPETGRRTTASIDRFGSGARGKYSLVKGKPL